ncbi:MAG: DUF305 domain-containing protein [Candidatus Microsaccharimonas sp.]
MQKNKYTIIVIATIVAVIITGIAVYAVNRNNINDKQSSNSQSTTDDVTAEDTNKFATLTGEAYDEAFIADMLAHHEGALSMAEIAGAATERKEILDLSQSIMQTQAQEIIKMQALQAEWGYEKTFGGHASHSGMGNEMSGTMMDMGKELEGLKGVEFDKKFLELMIEHHQQAVDMSKYADANASHQEIKDLAKQIIDAQEAEIAQMQQWQMDWGFASNDSGSSMPGMNH